MAVAGDPDRCHPGLPDRLLHGPHCQPVAFARLLVVAILMPLWASYLVKVFAWRSIFLGNGLLSWVLAPFGIAGPGNDEITNSWIVLSYMWLPYMILPIYAGLERVPNSLLEASADLGARAGTTFRRVVLPLVSPGAGGGVDLHLLADAGRLHRPGPGQRREVHRQRDLRQLGAGQLPGCCGVLDGADRDHARATCSSRGALGAFESL